MTAFKQVGRERGLDAAATTERSETYVYLTHV
jgi:hypothetical protein